MRERVFNWQGLKELGTRDEQLLAVKTALALYFIRPLVASGDVVLPSEQVKALEAMGVKLTTPSNTANTSARTPVVAGTFNALPPEDFGFMSLFDMVDMRGIPQSQFEILDTTNAISFTQRKPGEEAKIYEVSDAKAVVSFLEFAAGLGFLDVWFQFQQFYKFDDAAMQVRNKYYDQMAALHYGLFTALGAGVNQAFSATDSETIDNACNQIISDCKGKGYFTTERPQFTVVCNPGLARRLTKAIWPLAVNPNDTGSQPPINNINNLVQTWQLPNTSYYVVLPGNKLKRGVWMDLQVESARDILKSAEDFVWKGQYNAAIGDSQQVRRNSLS
jgi:hypothetical protein